MAMADYKIYKKANTGYMDQVYADLEERVELLVQQGVIDRDKRIWLLERLHHLLVCDPPSVTKDRDLAEGFGYLLRLLCGDRRRGITTPILHVLMGTQGSGKTTYATREMPALILLSSDSWFSVDDAGRKYWNNHNHRAYYSADLNPQTLDTAGKWVWQVFGELLRRSESFVLEGTFPSKISRSAAINIAHSFGYRVKVVWFNTELAECLRRNNKRVDAIPDAVLASTFASMEPPREDEGWDHIEVV